MIHLKNDLHLRTHITKLFLIPGIDILSVEENFAVRLLDQTQNRTSRCGLAASGLSYKSHGSSTLDVKADIIDCLYLSCHTTEKASLDWEIFL